jgi:hypothetical protein
MSTTLYLIQAQHLLELALDQARQERDRGVFEMARGERSLKQLQGLVERAALIRGLWQQTRSVLGAQDNPPPPTEFRPGEHWLSKDGLYRVESCPLIPSCVRLIPLAAALRSRSTATPATPTVFRGSGHERTANTTAAPAPADR